MHGASHFIHFGLLISSGDCHVTEIFSGCGEKVILTNRNSGVHYLPKSDLFFGREIT